MRHLVSVVLVLSALLPTTAAAIDLVADNLTLDPDQVEVGEALTVNWLGHIQGSGSLAGPFSIGFYLSLDPVISPSTDALLFQVNEQTAQRPGQTFGTPIALVVPEGTLPGAYYLGVLVDDLNAVAEEDETNNSESDQLTVTGVVTSPNLVAVSCSLAPTTAQPGEEVQFTWRGRNGGAGTTSLFQWGVYLSTDSTIERSDDLLASGTVLTGWAAGYDTGDEEETLALDGSLAGGTYFVGILLDTLDQVSELSENDNQCVTTLVVSSGGGVTRWLIPAAASAPGFGTSNWKSQIGIANPTDEQRSANLFYVAKGAAWPGSLLEGPITLPPLGASFLDDPLLDQNPTSGLMYVALDAAGPVTTSRTYNLAAGGATYGQGIPAIALDGASAPQRLILPMVHSVPGHFHTNLGLVQASSGSFTVEVSVYAPDGLLLGTKTYTRTGAYDQVNDLFANMGIGLEVEGAWIAVRLVSGSPTFWTCYASVVDDLTGDPAFIPPVEP